MSLVKKPLLLILQLNQALCYINNSKSKIKDFSSDAYHIKYDVQIDNFKVLWRNGRPQFLEFLFNIQKDMVDVAVWTNLDAKLGQAVAQKYFGRYYRDLLFVLPTNRGLYTSQGNQLQQPIKIPKQLSSVYPKFPNHNITNTLVLTCQPNTLQQYKNNDTFIPVFSPGNHTFQQDVGCLAISKYIRGILIKMKENKLNDVRLMNTGKPLDNLYRRLSHTTFTQTTYK